MEPELKHTIRKMIRDAIRWQNQQVLFTCRQCCFYRPAVVGGLTGTELLEENDELEVEATFKEASPECCTLEATNRLVLSKRMPTQLPECFTFDPLASAFVVALDTMHALGIETFKADRGWASIVGRIAQRADRYGYLPGVTQRNLDKYGS